MERRDDEVNWISQRLHFIGRNHGHATILVFSSLIYILQCLFESNKKVYQSLFVKVLFLCLNRKAQKIAPYIFGDLFIANS